MQSTTNSDGRALKLKLLSAWAEVRRQRDDAFGAELFDDAVWNIMLHLYGTQLRGELTTIMACCRVSGTSETSTYRALDRMEAASLIERVRDPADRRRVLVHLSPAAFDQIDAIAKAASGRRSRKS